MHEKSFRSLKCSAGFDVCRGWVSRLNDPLRGEGSYGQVRHATLKLGNEFRLSGGFIDWSRKRD